jgi:hypothetical protein
LFLPVLIVPYQGVKDYVTSKVDPNYAPFGGDAAKETPEVTRRRLLSDDAAAAAASASASPSVDAPVKPVTGENNNVPVDTTAAVSASPSASPADGGVAPAEPVSTEPATLSVTPAVTPDPVAADPKKPHPDAPANPGEKTPLPVRRPSWGGDKNPNHDVVTRVPGRLGLVTHGYSGVIIFLHFLFCSFSIVTFFAFASLLSLHLLPNTLSRTTLSLHCVCVRLNHSRSRSRWRLSQTLLAL